MRKELTYEPSYREYDIQNTQQGALIGCLDKNYKTLNMMLEKHSQVLLCGRSLEMKEF